MTAPTPAQLEKLFEIRRTGQIDPDHKADEEYLALLRVVEGGVVRELTEDDRSRKLKGAAPEKGRFVRVDILERDQAERMAKEVAAKRREAQQKQRDADRAMAEVKRLG